MKRQTVESIVCLAAIFLLLLIAIWLHLYFRHAPPAPIVATPAPAAAPAKGSASPLPAPIPTPAKPVVAVLGADWCGPCKRVERNVLPTLLDLDLIMVDVDTQKSIANALFSPKTRDVPQFVHCERTSDGAGIMPIDWLIGYHDAADVRTFASKPKAEPAPAPAPAAAAVPPCAPAAVQQRACNPAATSASGFISLRRLFHRGG